MEFYGNEEIDRAELYKLLSALFVEEPQEEVILRIKEMLRMEFDDTLQEIRTDFVGLFMRPDLHLSPHESLHSYPLGETPGLWGRATYEVQESYRSAGLMIDEESEIIPDHLGAELLFMSYLIGNDLAAQQRKFMDDHLFRWVPEFCDEIEKHAATTFYREVAILLKEFVVSDHAELSGGRDA
jgi:TorA maturation chaperone TorD